MTMAFATLVQIIANNMPDWRWQEPANKDIRDCWQYIVGPDGARLHLKLDHKKRITVYGEWPTDDRNNHYPTNNRPDTITVSSEKDPSMIARDIIRRYLPGYLEAYQRGKEEQAKHNAFHNGRTELALYLAGLCGVEPRKNYEHSIHVYKDEGGYFTIDISAPDSVRMDIRSLPPVKAEKIIAILMS